MKVGFGVNTDDILSWAKLTVLGETSDLPAKNMFNDRPRKPWEVRRVLGGTAATAGLLLDGWFEVDSTNKYIDLREDGSGSDTVITLTEGQYGGTDLASHIQTALAGVDSGKWRCSWGTTTGIFTIYSSDTSGGTQADFKWKTGAHGTDNANNSIAKEIGFRKFPNYTGTDSGNTFDIAGEARHWTHTWAEFSGTYGQAIAASLSPLIIDPIFDQNQNPRVDVADIKLFTNSSPQSGSVQTAHTRKAWEATHTGDATYSAQPGENQNRVRLATFGYSSNTLVEKDQKTWFFSWRHWDQQTWRHVNLLKAMPVRWDSSATNRTIRQLAEHGLLDDSPSLGIGNYYPVAIEERWTVTMEFDQWEAATFRSVIHGIIREGRHTGLLWALRLDELASGDVEGAAEADKGYLLWSALTDYSLDSYSGGASDYISATMSIEQIR